MQQQVTTFSEIKKASLQHLEVLANLFDRYRSFYGYPADVRKARLFLSERMQNKESVIFICISPENIVAGFVQLYPLFSSTRMQRLWLLNDLYVDERFRGNGYST